MPVPNKVGRENDAVCHLAFLSLAHPSLPLAVLSPLRLRRINLLNNSARRFVDPRGNSNTAVLRESPLPGLTTYVELVRLWMEYFET